MKKSKPKNLLLLKLACSKINFSHYKLILLLRALVISYRFRNAFFAFTICFCFTGSVRPFQRTFPTIKLQFQAAQETRDLSIPTRPLLPARRLRLVPDDLQHLQLLLVDAHLRKRVRSGRVASLDAQEPALQVGLLGVDPPRPPLLVPPHLPLDVLDGGQPLADVVVGFDGADAVAHQRGVEAGEAADAGAGREGGGEARVVERHRVVGEEDVLRHRMLPAVVINLLLHKIFHTFKKTK